MPTNLSPTLQKFERPLRGFSVAVNPDFSISANPSSLTVSPSSSTTITLTSVNRFSWKRKPLDVNRALGSQDVSQQQHGHPDLRRLSNMDPKHQGVPQDQSWNLHYHRDGHKWLHIPLQDNQAHGHGLTGRFSRDRRTG